MLKIPDNQTTNKIVIFFDICSSTKIIDQLQRTQLNKYWVRVLDELSVYLADNFGDSASTNVNMYNIYKFIGDGWVLLADEDVDGTNLANSFAALNARYKFLYNKFIKEHIEIEITDIGLTFGIDHGPIACIKINGNSEYIGRPLNVAARLQGAIVDKDEDFSPAGYALFSPRAFSQLFGHGRAPAYPYAMVKRHLKNLTDKADYQCHRVFINRDD